VDGDRRADPNIVAATARRGQSAAATIGFAVYVKGVIVCGVICTVFGREQSDCRRRAFANSFYASKVRKFKHHNWRDEDARKQRPRYQNRQNSPHLRFTNERSIKLLRP
jgi:hypothetical protein